MTTPVSFKIPLEGDAPLAKTEASSAVADYLSSVASAGADLQAGFRTVLECLHEGILVTDMDDVVLYANCRMAELAGYDVSEMVGRPAYELILPPSQWEGLRDRHEHRARGMSETYEKELLRKDGTYFTAHINAAPYRCATTGRILGTVGAISDVTERRRVERALVESEARFRSAFASAAIGMAMIHPDGRFIQVNDTFCQFLGYEADELLRLSIADVSHPEDLVENHDLIRQALKRRIPYYRMRKRYLHRDGHLVWGDLSGSVVWSEDDRSPLYIIGQVQDVTAQQRAEEEREASRRAASEAAQQQRVFLRDVLLSVTGGKLQLCDRSSDLPSAPDGVQPQMASLTAATLNEFRAAVREAAESLALPTPRVGDLLLAVGEASMNAVVHAGRGEASVYTDTARGIVQVWVEDDGGGISLADLPRATLERGYTTAGSMGCGFWMMLQTVDRVWLLTGPQGTTVVLEQGLEQPDPDDLALEGAWGEAGFHVG